MQSTECHCFSHQLSGRQPVAGRLLANAIGRGRMAHAYLFTGRCIAEKWLMARQLTAFLNCEKVDKAESGSCLLSYINDSGSEACDTVDDKTFSSACQNCRWLFRDEHPKAWVLLAKDAGKSGKIPVEAARNLSEELARTSQYLRVVVIEDASEDAFHRPAANALLKTIEEPRSNCLFLLFAECEEDVLRTIVSRCQSIPLNNRPEDNIGLLAGESPKVKSRLAEPFWQSEENQELLRRMRAEAMIATGLAHKLQTKDALAFGHYLVEALGDHDAETIFDLAVNLEVEKMAGSYRSRPAHSRYLTELFKLAAEARWQIDRYVTPKGVCEAFALRWLALRQKLSG